MKEESTVVGHYVNLGHEGDPDVTGHLKKTFTHEEGHEVTVSDTQLAHVGIGFEAEIEEGVPFAKATLTGKFEAWWEGSWTHTDKKTTKDTVRICHVAFLSNTSLTANRILSRCQLMLQQSPNKLRKSWLILSAES
jgi:hypothetical protein